MGSQGRDPGLGLGAPTKRHVTASLGGGHVASAGSRSSLPLTPLWVRALGTSCFIYQGTQSVSSKLSKDYPLETMSSAKRPRVLP